MKIPPFMLDQWLNQYHFAKQPPEFDLASSTGPHWTLGELLGLIDADERAGIMDTDLVYSSASGSKQLREAIGELQGVSAEDVQVVTGASEGLLILFCQAAESGANVVLPFPLFPATAVVADLFGLETRSYHLRRENDFNVDLDEIKKLTDGNTKVLFVNTPHNPTGATLSNEELLELHDFAADRGIQFVSDEVYHPIYHGSDTNSAALLPHATVLGSFSKSFSLSGLRTGWIIERDRARMQQYVDARGYFTISNPPLAEKFALIAMRHRQEMFARTRNVATRNLDLLDQFFTRHVDQLDWVRPRGGLTGFPWLKDGSNSRIFCEALADKGVLLAPGDCFQMPNHFRLGFGVAEVGFGSALERIDDYLAAGMVGSGGVSNVRHQSA